MTRNFHKTYAAWARTDDVINVAGHRLSTGAMEEVMVLHPAVAECAVIEVQDGLKGEGCRRSALCGAGDDRGSGARWRRSHGW